MSVIIKNLASGTINSTIPKTLGPGSGKSWLVKSVMLTNRDAAARGMDIKVTGTGTGSAVAYAAPPAMNMPPGTTAILDTEITLQYQATGSPETIGLTANTAPSTGIDYVLNGIERDL